jgi:tetratricopeptide (TPR) repeat protein
VDTALFLSAFFPLLAAYILTLSPTIPLEDGGEMIRAAFSLGVTHPPGYPLYTLVASLMSHLPVGDIAFRVNLLSALAAALACSVFAVTVAGILSAGGVKPRTARVSAWSGAILLGTGPAVWWQAVIAEKYAFNLLMNALVLAVLARILTVRKAAGGMLVLACLAFGLSMSHHGQTIFLAPALAIAAFIGMKKAPERDRGRMAGFMVVALALGLSIKFIYPSVRAAAHPLHNWNDPSNLIRWLDYFSGQPYQHRMFFWGPADLARRAREYLSATLPGEVGWAGLALGVWGTIRLFRGNFWLALALVSAWGAGVFYCINFSLYGIALRTYYMPTFLFYCVAASAGMARLASVVGGRWKRLAVPALAALGLWAVYGASSHRFESDRSRHYFAWDFSRSILRSAEPGSLLIAYGDYDLFPLWYTHDIAGVNPKVVLVNANFLPADWAKDERHRIQLMYDGGGKKVAYAEDLLKTRPPYPVYLSVIFEAVERMDFIPAGAAYRPAWSRAELLGADILGERRKYARWRTLRGLLSRDIFRDHNTRSMATYYAYMDYRRGVVLEEQGREDDALRMFRASLGWPDFFGLGPAAAHASIGQILRKRGRTEEALREYEAAVALQPGWIPGLRALGGFYAGLKRYQDALKTFKMVLAEDPQDQEAARTVKMLSGYAEAGN